MVSAKTGPWYSPLVNGAAARVALAAGLTASAALVALVGGGVAIAIGTAQAVVAGWLLARPAAPGPVGAAVLTLVTAPISATWHWTARLPGACPCARLPKPPPGLVSVTGLTVALDAALVVLAIWLAASYRQAEVGKSQP